MSGRACPVAGCGVQIRRGVFMCRAHWYATPAPLRRQINATWRDYQAASLGEPRRAAFRDYREATNEALRLAGSAP